MNRTTMSEGIARGTSAGGRGVSGEEAGAIGGVGMRGAGYGDLNSEDAKARREDLAEAGPQTKLRNRELTPMHAN